MPLHDVLRREHKPRSGLALGGIGAGWFELRKDGCFYDWNIMNNEPWGTGSRHPWPEEEDSMLFFLVRYQEQGRDPMMKLLQIDYGMLVAAIPNHYYTFPWVTGVDEIECTQSFPFTTLICRDKEMPLEIELCAFSPFIPGDAKNSSLPCAIFDFKVRSTSSKPVDVMLLSTMRNLVGYDKDDCFWKADVKKGASHVRYEVACGNLDSSESSFGQMAMASLSKTSNWHLGWEHRHPYYEWVIRNKNLGGINDTENRNQKDSKTRKKIKPGDRCFNSIAISKRLTGKKSFEHSFVMGWNFPNLYAGLTGKAKKRGDAMSDRVEGHYYSNFFSSAGEVVDYVIRNKKKLEDKTRQFHADFFDSTLPTYVLDQVNSHLNTFFTSSWFTKAGDFGIQEGMTREQNWGPLATIDVGMYGSLSAAALFPELDKAMYRAHMRLQTDKGVISHGIARDFQKEDAHESVGKRLDLPSQYIIMALRAYLWSHDKEFLREIWPSVQKAIDYVLRERDPDNDLLPDMEGCMCTYDNFPMYGPSSFVASQWLAALAYAAEAAREIGEDEVAETYEDVLGQAKDRFEEKLWNGSYYRLYNNKDGAVKTGANAAGKVADIDEGCLADQAIGQWATHFTGVEPVLKPARVRKALRSVIRQCFKDGYGLRNCRWPGESFLADVAETCWSDQHNTVWSGVELAFASFLIYEGMVKDGLRIVKTVDDRYRKFGLYFDHQEWGGHYYRPMSGWAILHAMAGASVHGDWLRFDPKSKDDNQKLFVAFAGNTGHFIRKTTKTGEKNTFQVAQGKFPCKELHLVTGRNAPSSLSVRLKGKTLKQSQYEADFYRKELKLRLKRKTTLTAGTTIEVTIR